MTEGSIAWVGEGAFWAHLELPHTVLGDCVGLWGFGVRLRFHKHFETDMGAHEGLGGERCRTDGTAEIFCLF